MTQGLLDTSVWIAREVGRPLALDRLPDEVFVCVITLAELQAGVLAARDTVSRARRMATLQNLARVTTVDIGQPAALQWAALRATLGGARRRVKVNDLWIAAVALANELPVFTQDDDFDVMAELSDLEVVKV